MLLFMLVLSVEAKSRARAKDKENIRLLFFQTCTQILFVSCVLKSTPAKISENQKRSESFKLAPWLVFPVRNELSGSIVIKKQR